LNLAPVVLISRNRFRWAITDRLASVSGPRER
jgi:hypothetical protein